MRRLIYLLIVTLAFCVSTTVHSQTQSSSCPLVFHDSGYLGDRPLVRTTNLDLGPSGKFTLKTTVPADEDEKTKAKATFLSRGRSVFNIVFSNSWPRGWVDASVANIKGLPSPLVFAVASSMRADGVSTDTALVAFSSGRFRRIFPRNILTDINDAICLNEKTVNQAPSLHILTYTEGDYGVVVWPKYYKVTSYAWIGQSFRLVGSRITARKHEGWDSAINEFGIRCDLEVLSTTVNQP